MSATESTLSDQFQYIVDPKCTDEKDSVILRTTISDSLSPTVTIHPECYTRTHDFKIIPIPKRLRWDPQGTFEFTLFLNVVFGLVCTSTAANLYYCQPLLVNFAESFGASGKDVSLVPTLSQAGYVCGLLFITPLGDLVRRRPFLLVMLSLSTLFSLCVALAPNLLALQILSFFFGASTVIPQILFPFAGDLVPAHRRAASLAIILSGVLLGIIYARAIGGIVAYASHSWRTVYLIAVGLQSSMLLLSWWTVPDLPSKVELLEQAKADPSKRLSYIDTLLSMAKLAVTEPTLIQGYLIAFGNQMLFSSFWVTLTFLLAEPPYNFSTLEIGLFGLVGTLGIFTAPFVGRLIDGLVFWVAILMSISILLTSQLVMTAAAGISLGAVIVGCIGVDLGLQLQQVSVTSHIYGIDPASRARVNAVYFIVAFLGQVVGSAVGSHVFLTQGWKVSSAVCVGFAGLMLIALLARGPHCGRYTWFGWEGGARMTKEDAARNDIEAPATSSVTSGSEEKSATPAKSTEAEDETRRH